jgi:hypothetical protein
MVARIIGPIDDNVSVDIDRSTIFSRLCSGNYNFKGGSISHGVKIPLFLQGNLTVERYRN